MPKQGEESDIEDDPISSAGSEKAEAQDNSSEGDENLESERDQDP